MLRDTRSAQVGRPAIHKSTRLELGEGINKSGKCGFSVGKRAALPFSLYVTKTHFSISRTSSSFLLTVMMRSTTGWRCRLIVCSGSARFLYDACNLCVNGLIFLLSYRLNKIWKSPWRREFSLMKARESGPRGSGIFFLWNNNPSFVFVLFVPLWHFNNRGQYPNCKQLTKTTYCHCEVRLQAMGNLLGHLYFVSVLVLCFGSLSAVLSLIEHHGLTFSSAQSCFLLQANPESTP